MRFDVPTLLLLAIISPGVAAGQYPERPITLLVGYGTGSAGDQIARGLAEAAKKHLRQPIVVVNRPGASGTIGISEALRAEPDGYTLGLGTAGTLTVQPNRTTLPYAGPETYAPVAKLVTESNILMVRRGSPWTNAREFLKYGRTHPGQVTVGVPGPATIAHLNIEQLERLANVTLKVVYFDGPEQVSAALLGHVDAAIAVSGQILPSVKAGEAVGIGVFDEHRLPGVRTIPTFKELGFDVTLGTFQAIIAPRLTAAPVIKALDEAIRKAVTEPSFVALAKRTQNLIDYKGPERFAAELRQAFETNGDLVRKMGLGQK